MTEPVIRSIPLHRLEPSPANVRKTTAGQAAFAELKASIAAHGLLENLVARDVGPAEDLGERFAVIAGARRLAALNELAGEGVIEANHPVPCRIVTNGAADGEISLAENVVRVAMHPADQVEAFGALALAGSTVADIAARFGVSERIVEQRLRLGHAAPELLDAYRENAIDLETLKAFAVTTDTARQVAVWEQVKDQGYRPTGWQIKRMLTEDRIPAGAALARYVGIDTYEAAGGPVLRDLFADEHENGVWLEDPVLLMQLAMDRLKVAADELATRWKWADGTGCGKGRQVAAMVLDQWLRGRKRALWLSQSDKLLEDARRDWCAIGGRADDVIPLGKVRQGAGIPQAQGILFATYATLRSPARQGKPSRLDQIVAWLADGEHEAERHAYQGVIVFDEAHAMANAAGSKGSRGEVKPSQQGRAGLRLQNALPDARILYVSATGATTVPGLAYARRLGLWASGETPFETRTAFIAAMEAGGVAAMEVVARDLKALGLYQARALSYDGVKVDILEHLLTDEQRRIYDSYAGAFKIIHQNIQEALKATGIVDGESTLNKNAKSAALSAFEGAKQRFFGHLLTSMKCPSLIRAIEADLEEGRSAVVQLVSTGEALMERRIAEIPASEWDDLSIDLTPREYVLDFLEHAFPVQLQEPFEDDDGNLMSRPVFDADNNPVLCQEALAKREALIQKLGALPPVQSALDQIVLLTAEE